VNLEGWKILSERGGQVFVFPEFVLKAGGQVMVGGYDSRESADFIWEDGNGVWNNSKSDPAILYDARGIVVDRYED
jgi:hypothetical protein